MKYTRENLMPKPYPENKPEIDGAYWVYDKVEDSWVIYKFADNDFSGVDQYIDYYIPVPGAPLEVRPLAYPKHKPNKFGNYIVHYDQYRADNGELFDNHWTTNYWNADEWFDNRRRVDYFIPVCLDESEEDVNDKDKILTLKAEYTGSGGIAYFRNADDSPLDEEHVATFIVSFIAPYLYNYDITVTKRGPEIAPCPNPECGARNIYGELPHFEEDGCGNFRVACNCGYRGPLHATREGAIRIHNLIAENIQRKEE